jgi:hypothetical protein
MIGQFFNLDVYLNASGMTNYIIYVFTQYCGVDYEKE